MGASPWISLSSMNNMMRRNEAQRGFLCPWTEQHNFYSWQLFTSCLYQAFRVRVHQRLTEAALLGSSKRQGGIAEKRARSYLQGNTSTMARPFLGAKELYTFLPDDIEKLRIGPLESKLYSIRVFGSFEYPKLPGPDYIRLLHLEPASDNPLELRGCLKVHRLDAQCEYEAISYAWGDYPEFNRALFLENQVLKITGNLYAALMAYSYPDRTRVLWADAVCINQADTVEKTQQVAIMADIFSKAKTVQIWLTPASGWAKDAMDFMANLSSKAESFGISAEVDQPRWIPSWPSLNITDEEAKNLIHDAIEAHVDYLLFRSWFNRVWVVQEVTLAVKLVVSCGHSAVDWTNFARALEILRGALRQIPQGEERSRLEGIKPAWELVRHRDVFRLLDQHGDRNHHLMTNLAGVQMSNKACSDDRDRVYAMLAMTRSPYSMTPDYDKTVAEAYTNFTRRYSPNTQIYSAGLCRRQPRTNFGGVDMDPKNNQRLPIDIADRNYLPSWVPEFRPSLNLAWASPFNGNYCTAKGTPFYFLPHPEMLNVMCVTGTIFDAISITSWEYDSKSALNCVYDSGFYFSVIDLLEKITCSSPDFVFQPISEPPWLILAKTLTCGTGECYGAEFPLVRYSMFQSLNHLEQGSLPWLTAIWDRFTAHCFAPTGEVFQHMLLKTLGVEPRPLSTDGKIAYGFLVYLANTLVYNRLFITMEGYVGLAPRYIRGGDLVAILNGCHIPYVVRPAWEVKYKDELLKGALQVIGPCYLHGIMNGEILTNRDAPRFSRLKWTRHDGDMADSLEGNDFNALCTCLALELQLTYLKLTTIYRTHF
ncbi:uncharacterized protein BDR25DRAFT_395756 [Lindgomyces ingoldianus]|uniref:Uncharacterized protein n=1 Tax=Lindgomyces ingoldianus TaxID=673940 RepID=A0ACB6QI70_9PLEO|nr:uncharacterized protein BDR25DRAFT_395756 [Lindgomyces ingoldianus]KAF2466653.1 hypothetical protein BDR25DRAFT_395756 [Lindgomyces ingoldianus]